MSGDILYDDHDARIIVHSEALVSPWAPSGQTILDVELCNHYGSPEKPELDALMGRAQAGSLLQAWKVGDSTGLQQRTYDWFDNLDAYVVGWIDPDKGLQLEYWIGSDGHWLQDCPIPGITYETITETEGVTP